MPAFPAVNKSLILDTSIPIDLEEIRLLGGNMSTIIPRIFLNEIHISAEMMSQLEPEALNKYLKQEIIIQLKQLINELEDKQTWRTKFEND
jgi:hypothetical protein